MGRLLILSAIMILFGISAFAQEAPVKAPQRNFVVLRGGYLGAYQGNGGGVSTGVIEVGYRHWFNSKIYGAFAGGIFPFSADGVEGPNIGASASARVGFNLDNIIRLEYGADYHWWGNAMRGTAAGLWYVSIPTKAWGLNEVFGGVSFPGNAGGKTPLFIFQIGVGKLF